MKTGYKKLIYSIVFIFICITLLCPVAFCKTPEPTSDFFVNDYADILSDETEQEIQNTAVQLYTDTTAQVCVLTIDSLDGKDISEYSVEVFRDWGIGDAEKDNGVLILVSLNDREMWVTTGYGVEGTLTDVKLGQMRDIYAIPHYSEDDFDTGTRLLFGAIVNELRTVEYGIEPDENLAYFQSDIVTEDSILSEMGIDNPIAIFLIIWSLLVIVPIISRIYRAIRYIKLLAYDREHGTTRAIEYKKQIAKKRLRTNTHTTIHHGGFHGGGGFGGGGGFSGGGGSTGGGGAGGRF